MPAVFEEILGIASEASSADLIAAVTAARRRWNDLRTDPHPSRRILAAHRLRSVAEAERIVLAARINGTTAAGATTAPSGHTIDTRDRTGPDRLELPDVIQVCQQSSSPFMPVLNQDKSPVLNEGEHLLGLLSGPAFSQYRPWPGAQDEAIDMPGPTTAYVTNRRLIFVAPDFVPPRIARDHVANRESLIGMAAGFALTSTNQTRYIEEARQRAAGRALVGQIPLEFLETIFVIPKSEEGGGLGFTLGAGSSTHIFAIGQIEPDSLWLRGQAEWLVRVAMAARAAILGAHAYPSEHALIAQWLAYPSPEYEPEGMLAYNLPLTFDGAALRDVG